MSKPKTIKLTLTEEEVGLIEKALITEVFDCRESIKMYEAYPDSDNFARYAADAKANIPVIEELHRKIARIEFEQKYSLLEGEEP